MKMALVLAVFVICWRAFDTGLSLYLVSTPYNGIGVNPLVNIIMSRMIPLPLLYRDSCERSGLYCVIHYLLDRLESATSVNLPLIVNRIRQYCVNAVSSVSQYRFCYEAAQVYLDSFNTYANFT